MTARVNLVGLGLLALGAVAASEPSDGSADLAAPFVVEAIKRLPESGTSRPQQSNQYPWFGDFDGDGRPDLLMGDADPETSRGRLRIYRNGGSAADPAFDVPIWFHDLCSTCRESTPPNPVRYRQKLPDGLELIVKCRHCQAPMELASHEHRPSRRELFYGPDHPR